LYPGDAGKDLSVWYKNNGSGSEWVGDITGSVANNGNCLGAWFTVDTIHVDASVAPGAQPHAASHIKLNNVNVNQDACQAKSVTINWASDVTNQPTPTP
jgi:hypothetical protein